MLIGKQIALIHDMLMQCIIASPLFPGTIAYDNERRRRKMFFSVFFHIKKAKNPGNGGDIILKSVSNLSEF